MKKAAFTKTGMFIVTCLNYMYNAGVKLISISVLIAGDPVDGDC